MCHKGYAAPKLPVKYQKLNVPCWRFLVFRKNAGNIVFAMQFLSVCDVIAMLLCSDNVAFVVQWQSDCA